MTFNIKLNVIRGNCHYFYFVVVAFLVRPSPYWQFGIQADKILFSYICVNLPISQRRGTNPFLVRIFPHDFCLCFSVELSLFIAKYQRLKYNHLA